MLRKIFGKKKRHDNNTQSAVVSQLTAQVVALKKEVVTVKEELATTKVELTDAQKRLARIDRLAALFSAGKDIGATAIANYLEQGNYPAARELVLSKVPEGEILIDFASLDEEEGSAVIKGVLKRISKTLDSLEDKEGVEPGAIKDVKKYMKILRTDKDLIVTSLTECGTLDFENLRIEDKTASEIKDVSERASALIYVQQSVPVANAETPHPGLIFSRTTLTNSPNLPQPTATVAPEQTDTQDDTVAVRFRLTNGEN